MQLLVLGMHRSGTSVVTRLLNMMGAYFGPEGSSIGANPENPKGFWERRDVRQLNDALLAAAGASWHDVANFSIAGIPEAAQLRFAGQARRLLLELDAHRPWVIKEPRLCLLLPLWRPLLELPVSILVYRPPLEVAHSLQARNGLPLELGVALWERYVHDALAASAGLPRLVVRYEAILADPVAELGRLHGQLVKLGVTPLRLPGRRETEVFVDRRLYRHRQQDEHETVSLNDEQLRLCRLLEADNGLGDEEPPALSTGARETLEAHHHSGDRFGPHLAATSPSILSSPGELWARIGELETQLGRARSRLDRLRQRYRKQARSVHRLRRERWLAGERLELERERERQRETERRAREEERVEQDAERAKLHERLRGFAREFEELKTAYQERSKRLAKLLAEQRGLRKRLQRVESVNRDLFASRSYRVASSLSALYGLLTRARRSPRAPRPAADGKAAGEATPPEVDPPAAPLAPAVDIVVCVHDALEHVERCLRSLLDRTPPEYRLILINDGSNEATSRFLRELAAGRAEVSLLESDEATGYTCAANRGLRASSAELVVLLNSDTVLTAGWLEGLMEVAKSSPRIGILGPLSNAASWQSVPARFADDGGWAVNELPLGIDVDRMARIVAASTPGVCPRVPFINGFCYVIRRRVIDAIGYLDEESFPWGYGEENDYSLRAAAAGFELVVADRVYVFHAKTKSYGGKRRRQLSRAGNVALAKKHGQETIESRLEEIRDHPGLARVRQAVKRSLEGAAPHGDLAQAPSVLYVLSSRGGGGGAHSVVQEAIGIARLGHRAAVAVRPAHLETFLEAYPEVLPQTFVPYREESLTRLAARFDVAVATMFTSVKEVARLCEQNPRLLPAYYIQDYEPWFVSDTPELEAEALASYTLLPDALLFAKTEWLCRLVSEIHGVAVHKVTPSLDTEIYYPAPQPPALGHRERVRVAAMIRPRTPRRAPAETMEILERLSARFGDRLQAVLFGCEPDDPEFLALSRRFPFEHRGVLRREQVAELLRGCSIFVDFSSYQAFGRTALEAMACGCATIVPERGGAGEYARHLQNALAVDTASSAAMEAALERLVSDSELRARLAKAGLETAAGYSIAAASASELRLFKSALERHEPESACEASPVAAGVR